MYCLSQDRRPIDRHRVHAMTRETSCSIVRERVTVPHYTILCTENKRVLFRLHKIARDKFRRNRHADRVSN